MAGRRAGAGGSEMSSSNSHRMWCAAAHVCAVAVVFAAVPSVKAQCGNQASIDGRNLTVENACAPHELQDNYTGFTDTQSARTSGSELDTLYISNDFSKLYIGITGNIGADFENTLLIFVQARPVCNQLFTATADSNASNALKAMDGIQFDGTPSGGAGCNQD